MQGFDLFCLIICSLCMFSVYEIWFCFEKWFIYVKKTHENGAFVLLFRNACAHVEGLGFMKFVFCMCCARMPFGLVLRNVLYVNKFFKI